MISRAIIPTNPNFIQNSISPTPRKPKFPFSITFGQKLRPESRTVFRPSASAGDVGTVGDFPATEENFYELLGIPVGGSHDEIKRAYKQLALKYHPDVSPPDLVEEYTHRFILVQEAYETLIDPECRAIYDRCLVRGFQFAFSARRRFDEDLEKKSRWKNRWQDQLLDLKRRGAIKNSEENLSWGARMRRRRADSSADQVSSSIFH